MMAEKPISGLSLTEARARLQEIVDRLEKDAIELDQLPGAIEEARKLLDHCEEKLRRIQEESREAGGAWWGDTQA